MCSVLTSDSRTRVQTVPASTVGNRTGIRAFGLPAVGAYTLGAGSAAVWVEGRTLLQQVGQIDVGTSAGAWVVLGAGGAAAALLAGWLSRRTITVSWLITATGTGAATAFIGLFAQTISIAYTASALFGFAFNAATSVLIIWAGRIQAESAAGTSLLPSPWLRGRRLDPPSGEYSSTNWASAWPSALRPAYAF